MSIRYVSRYIMKCLLYVSICEFVCGRRKSTLFLGFNPSTKIGTYGALQDRLAFAILLNPNWDLSVGYVPFSLEPQNPFQKSQIVLFWNGSKRVGFCFFGMEFR